MFQLRIIRISLVLTALVVNPTQAQITWNNVYSNPMPDNSRQMDSARNSINAGFDQLRNELKAREDTERSNWRIQKDNNTQDYLDALYNEKTVEDLLANQGALEQKRIGYGAQIDRDVARSAFDARLSTLKQQAREQVVKQDLTGREVLIQATANKQGFGTQPEAKTQTEMVQNIATVNGKVITAARVEQVIKQVIAQGKQADSPQLRESIKKDLIGREILMQEAEKQGFGKDVTVKQQIDNARQSIIINAMVGEFLKKNPITDADIKAEYDRFAAQAGDKEYHVRHILLGTAAEAHDIIAKLKGGAKFEDLAKTSKDTGSAGNGGDLDWATPSSFPKPFSDAFIALQKGQITQTPVQTPNGFHVIKLDDVRPAKLPTLEEVKPQIAEALQQKKLQAYQEEMVKKARVQ